jgi:hypothetical protein
MCYLCYYGSNRCVNSGYTKFTKNVVSMMRSAYAGPVFVGTCKYARSATNNGAFAGATSLNGTLMQYWPANVAGYAEQLRATTYASVAGAVTLSRRR